MLRVRAVKEQVKSGTPEQIETAAISFGSALIFGCVPLLLTLFLLLVSHHFTKSALKPIFLNGDLLILTNGTVAASSMLIGKQRRSRERFPGGDLFLFVGGLLLTISAGVFFMAKLFEVLEYRNVSNRWLLAAVLILFVFGSTYSYLVVLLDGICEDPALSPESDFEADEEKMKQKRIARRRTTAGSKPRETI